VLHVHDFDHMEINLIVTSDGFHGIDDDLSEWVGNSGVDLGVQGGACNADQEISRHLFLRDLEIFEESESLLLGFLKTINDDSGVDAFAEVSLGLTHELTNEKNISCGAISNDIVLSGSSSTDHSSCRVLDLHLVKQNAAIFSQLDLTGATDEPLKCKRRLFSLKVSRKKGQFLWRQSRRVDFYLHLKSSLGSQVRLEDFLKSLSGIDIDAKSGSLAHNIGLGVNELE
jgi:hypothetical protein